MPQKRGLALGGGGARGAYQIGVWRACRETGLTFDAVAGTSVGAISGALVAQDPAGRDEALFRRAEEIWSQMDISCILQPRSGRKLSFSESSRLSLPSLLAYYAAERAPDITPIRLLLETIVDEERLRRSPCTFMLCTFGLSDLKLHNLTLDDIPKGRLVDYILASAALPGLIRSEIDGKRYLDGGLGNVLPIAPLIAQGCTDILAVDIAFGLSQRYTQGNCRITRVKPQLSLGSILCFEETSCRRNLERGYRDARRALGLTWGHHFYFLPLSPESEVSPAACPPDAARSAAVLMQVLQYMQNTPRLRLWARVMDRALTRRRPQRSIQPLDEAHATASDLARFFTLLERAGLRLGLSRETEWTFSAFVDEIRRQSRPLNPRFEAYFALFAQVPPPHTHTAHSGGWPPHTPAASAHRRLPIHRRGSLDDLLTALCLYVLGLSAIENRA